MFIVHLPKWNVHSMKAGVFYIFTHCLSLTHCKQWMNECYVHLQSLLPLFCSLPSQSYLCLKTQPKLPYVPKPSMVICLSHICLLSLPKANFSLPCFWAFMNVPLCLEGSLFAQIDLNHPSFSRKSFQPSVLITHIIHCCSCLPTLFLGLPDPFPLCNSTLKIIFYYSSLWINCSVYTSPTIF